MVQAEKPVDDPAGNTAAVECIGQLRDRTGAAVGQPFSGSRPVIGNPCGGLQVQYHDRHPADLMDGKDGRAVHIGA